ncbi:MAG: hypothetical protein KKF44_05050 [Nanoarchaeota archaeon]|nr:hypothetical protein [Nanoarchaeota archaeon]
MYRSIKDSTYDGKSDIAEQILGVGKTFEGGALGGFFHFDLIPTINVFHGKNLENVVFSPTQQMNALLYMIENNNNRKASAEDIHIFLGSQVTESDYISKENLPSIEDIRSRLYMLESAGIIYQPLSAKSATPVFSLYKS